MSGAWDGGWSRPSIPTERPRGACSSCHGKRRSMKSRSIGTQVALRWHRPSTNADRAGFTLLEALVALALVLAFAVVLGPFLFQARHLVANADGRVAAQVLLRSLLEIPLDRKQIANASREGQTNGL